MAILKKNCLIAMLCGLMLTALTLPAAADECAESLTLRHENATRVNDNAFRLFLDINQNSPCQYARIRIEFIGERLELSMLDANEFKTESDGNSITWTGQFSSGVEHDLGLVEVRLPAASFEMALSYQTDPNGEFIRFPGPNDVPYFPIQLGSISGIKYNDRNCNGVRDPGEPGMPNWTMTAFHKPSNTRKTAVTDSDGRYVFDNLKFAPWFIYEDQQAGWAQTAPTQGRYEVVLQSNISLRTYDFGNVRICEEPQRISLSAGSKDNFSDRPEATPAAPSPELRERLSGSILTGFDETSANRFFAHSFTDYLRPGCCVVGARLTISFRSLDGLGSNDALYFVQNGELIYGISPGDVAGNAWTGNGTSTVVLDLGNLPPRQLTSVLPAMMDGTLDFFIQDDTSVDWVDLEVELCCTAPEDCCEHISPFYSNDLDLGPCCFQIGLRVDEGYACQLDAVRMTINGNVNQIDYFGPDNLEYSIANGQVSVFTQVHAGIIELGTWCIQGSEANYTVDFEYFDPITETWVSCNQELELYCAIESGEICGVKYDDLNCNGMRDEGEPGLRNWEITIVNTANNVSQTRTTAPDGSFCFTDLAFATWRVRETQQNGWVQTAPATASHTVVLSNSDPSAQVQFGNHRACERPTRNNLRAGTKDEFAATPDAPGTFLTPELSDYLDGRILTGFDATVSNRFFAHSFVDFIPENCCLVGATLSLRIKTLPGASSNDSFVIVQDGVAIYSIRISTLVGYPWSNAGPVTIDIDLGNLPLNQVTSVLPAMMDGTLDFFIQDDTSVDYAVLRVDLCCDDPTDCCEHLQPVYQNNPAIGPCCFDLGIEVAEEYDCEFSAIRLTPLSSTASISYAGDGSHNYVITGGTLTVNTTLSIGLVDLGTYCISGSQTSHTLLIEYFDPVSQTWIDCEQELTLFCTIESGSICGTKYWDKDCNGAQDDGDTGLGGWEIVIVNQENNVVLSTFTADDGTYKFEDLEYAPWLVYEVQQSGWVQTAPPTGSYRPTLNSNQAVEDLDFGNYSTCTNVSEHSVTAGEDDGFGPGPDFAPAAPSADLQSWLSVYPLVGFDDPLQNRFFAHSFTDCLGPECCVVAARLELQVRTNGGLSYNDRLVIMQDGTSIYSIGIGTLAGVYWSGQPATVISLDLGNLTPGLTSSVLPALQDGTLDFFIQDDTSVDWAKLYISCCVRTTTSVQIDEEALALTLFPNPVGSDLNMTFELERAQNVAFNIVDVKGRRLKRIEAGMLGAGKQTLSIDVSSLPAGAHLASLILDGRRATTVPLTIQR